LLMMDGGDDVEVPNLIGLSFDEAKATIKYNNLRYGSGVINPGGGIVTFQDPKAHTKIEKNSKVQIVVEVVNGFNVVRVKGSGGQLFVQVDGRVWHELRADGRKAFDFRETRRDEWSVYLVDNSRGVNIQIDLHRKEIIYSDSRGKKFVLAKVLESFK
jgi:PASTA domain-containing protein